MSKTLKNKINKPKKAFNKAAGVAYIGQNDAFQTIDETHLTAQELARALNPPDIMIARVLHGHRVADTFALLENPVKSTRDWLAREEKKFDDYIKDPVTPIEDVKAFYGDARTEPSSLPIYKLGKRYFRTVLMTDKNSYSRAIEIADKKGGPWTVALGPGNLDASDASLTLNSDLIRISPDGGRIAYFVSAYGRDAGELRIRDVETGQDLPDRISYPEALPRSVSWKSGSSDTLVYTAQDGSLSEHVIGSDEPDKIIAPKSLGGKVTPLPFASSYEWVNIKYGTDKQLGIAYRPAGSDDAFTVLLPPRTATLTPLIERDDGSILALSTWDAPKGEIIALSLDKKDPHIMTIETVIPESETDILTNACIAKDKILGFYTHNAAGRAKVFDADGTYLRDVPLRDNVNPHPMPSHRAGKPFVFDDGHVPLRIDSFTKVDEICDYDIETNKITPKGNMAYSSLNLDDCIVEQLWATSKDGTKVPMTVVRHPDTKLDGTAATMLYGYGGFGKSLLPQFSMDAAQFIRAGGIYVQANIRGGAEFGEEWHADGCLENKQNSFDDFAACARQLITQGYTTPKRLAIKGGSNGGLLTTATALQNPKLFGAVIASCPVTDIIGLKGAWKIEYGDPEKVKKDFNIAAAYSPLQNIKHGAHYPPMLIITADNDDRVPPSQAYKFAAVMQAETAADNTVLLHVEKGASHTSSSDPRGEYAKELAFIEKAIGPVNQRAYRTWGAQKKRQKKTHENRA